jgi:K+-sensing histidine kinase KdpD
LARLLDKLLSNAAEHRSSDGEVRVSLQRKRHSVELGVENDGDSLPIDSQRVLDAFFTDGKNSVGAEHLGLGLFVDMAIVESHGGSIGAESLVQRNGVRFVVRLPAG